MVVIQRMEWDWHVTNSTSTPELTLCMNARGTSPVVGLREGRLSAEHGSKWVGWGGGGGRNMPMIFVACLVSSELPGSQRGFYSGLVASVLWDPHPFEELHNLNRQLPE